MRVLLGAGVGPGLAVDVVVAHLLGVADHGRRVITQTDQLILKYPRLPFSAPEMHRENSD